MNNSYDLISSVSQHATIRWGLSATPYNNRWKELLAPIAWVTDDRTWLDVKDEERVKRLVRPPNGGPQEWYFKDEAPELSFQLYSRLIVLPFTTASEAWVDQSDMCMPPATDCGRDLADGNYKKIISRIGTSTGAERRRLKPTEINPVIKRHVQERQLAPLGPIGERGWWDQHVRLCLCLPDSTAAQGC